MDNLGRTFPMKFRLPACILLVILMLMVPSGILAGGGKQDEEAREGVRYAHISLLEK
jgi:hypothetical protein